MRRSALVFAALCAVAGAGSAQPAAIGAIEEMRSGRSRVDSTDAVRLSAAALYARRPARQRDALHERELVELLEPYYVRATLLRGGAEGRARPSAISR